MTIKRSYITTLGDCLLAIAPYIGGSVPASTTVDYANLVRWIVAAQEDAAKRAQWSRLLAPATLTLTAGDTEKALPLDFHKRTGIYIFDVNGVDWSEYDNADGQTLTCLQDQVTGEWKVRFGTAISADTTATLWYFFNPPIPVDETDPIFLDGDMIVFGALKEHFRKARQPGSQDDARIEYENRLREQLSLDNMPSKQELLGFNYPKRFRTSDKQYYYSGRK